jgi:hypothetical protein
LVHFPPQRGLGVGNHVFCPPGSFRKENALSSLKQAG